MPGAATTLRGGCGRGRWGLGDGRGGGGGFEALAPGLTLFCLLIHAVWGVFYVVTWRFLGVCRAVRTHPPAIGGWPFVKSFMSRVAPPGGRRRRRSCRPATCRGQARRNAWGRGWASLSGKSRVWRWPPPARPCSPLIGREAMACGVPGRDGEAEQPQPALPPTAAIPGGWWPCQVQQPNV